MKSLKAFLCAVVLALATPAIAKTTCVNDCAPAPKPSNPKPTSQPFIPG